MKKLLLVTALMIIFLNSKAQTSDQSEKQSKKTEYNLLWGLLRSDNYEKKGTDYDKSICATPNTLVADTSSYETESILWGAIRWTKKKNSKSSLNK